MTEESVAAAEPSGFHIMMPPGWVRYLVDAEGKAALVAQATAKMRELSRPDLDAQARSMIQSYWQTLIRQRISAIYLPTGSGEAGIPLSIAAKQHAAPPGVPFEESLPALAVAPIERFETPIGVILRWQKDSRGRDEMAGVTSRQVGYGFPLPIAGDRRGMVFLASIAYPDDAAPEAVALMTETSDTIMETFRWR
ncbi:hypothetical protein [Microbacterium hibisci]|uniref:hypothetical protein n=1 Tax=Microbacterium hibisci TaxID=2036000 RepID=UPI0019448E6A|nr:hypothetical protein [Microbacterium hibisci]